MSQQLSKHDHEQIEKLAYSLWEQRGQPLGSPEVDWFLAEQEFFQQVDSPVRFPFSSLTMGPIGY